MKTQSLNSGCVYTVYEEKDKYTDRTFHTGETQEIPYNKKRNLQRNTESIYGDDGEIEMMSEENRRKISERMKANNPMKNPITAKKCGETLKRKYKNKEIIHYWKGKRMHYLTKRNLENNPMRNPESVEKMKNTLKEGYKTGRLKSWCDGLTKETDKRLKKISEISSNRKFSELTKGKIKENHWSKSNQRDKIIRGTAKKRIEGYASGRLINYLKGKKMPQEAIKKQIETKRKNGTLPQLEKNPMWKGGLSFEPYGLDFNKKIKKIIKERDGCCLMCNVGFEDLRLLRRTIHIHHIDYNKQNNFIQNFVTLCVKCHTKTNTNRLHWTKFFHSLLAERYSYKYDEEGKIILEVKDEIH